MWFAVQQRAFPAGREAGPEGESPVRISGSVNSAPGCMEGSGQGYKNKAYSD